ncbi:MAG: phosphate ABC transporter substrate-binding protein [Candidatus Zixiibacteriota bacterium]
MTHSSAAISGLLCLVATTIAGETITIKGSDTMVRLGQRWAEEYMALNKTAVIQVTGGGTGAGVAALLNSGTDVCQASRDLSAREFELASKKRIAPLRITVALDAVAVYLHKANPVESLSLGQLRGIYTGAITSWRDLGGPDHRIVLYSRENSSGTYVLFREVVLKNHDYAPEAQTLPGTAAVINAVAHDRYGIGYGGIAWESNVKHAMVKPTDTSAAVSPTDANVSRGEYPIARKLYWFTNGEPTGELARLRDFVLSDTGQQIAAHAGYFPLLTNVVEKTEMK